MPRTIASLILMTVLLLACRTDPPAPPDANGERRSVAGDTLQYRGSVAVDPAAGTLEAVLTIELPSQRTGAPEFFLNAGFAIESITGEAVLDHRVETVDDNWSRLELILDPDLVNDPMTLTFAYAGKPRMPDNEINAIRPMWVELSVDSAWHPVVASFDRSIHADLSIDLPPDWTLVASGQVRREGGHWRLTQQISQPDIAFIGAPALDNLEGRRSVVHHQGRVDEARRVLSAAAFCREALDERFGAADPLPDPAFVLASRDESGYARKNYIVLSDVSETPEESLVTFVCHELAHYWSTGAAPLTVDNWLNEGFAVYVSARLASERFGAGYYEQVLNDWTARAVAQPGIWSASDPSRRPHEVNYKKGPLALEHLRRRVGDEAMNRIVTRYMLDPVNDTPALLEVIAAEAGPEQRDWFATVLAADELPPLGSKPHPG